MFMNRLRDRAGKLFEALDRFANAQVLVIGDLMLDEFLTGQVERVSREAPVLILRHEKTERVPGGGANAVCNFAALGAKVKVAGMLGQDEPGNAIVQIFQSLKVETTGIVWDQDRPTVTKTRIAGHSQQSVTQQIVRIDRKSDALPHLDLQHQLADYVLNQVDQADAIVCSDYGEGVLTQPVIKAALQHPRTIVDSQKQIPNYPKAFLFTPNLPEAELAVGYAIRDAETRSQAGRDLLAMTQAEYILITQGEQGMTLFDRAGQEDHIPAFNRTQVFDVTGAGDTVVAALTLGLVAGASPWEAAVLGNLAASIVVRQFGTATTAIAQIQAALETLLTREN
jgi:D-glycero-beta-D-manno-heptose-7-phosphate kinase